MRFKDLERGETFVLEGKPQPNVYMCLIDGWSACIKSDKHPERVGKVYKFRDDQRVIRRKYIVERGKDWII